MELFEAYDKYVKPEDDAAAAALAEAAKKSDDQLWDDNQPPTVEENKVVDQPGDQNKTSTGSNLSETDIDAIAKRLAEIMGQKGGSDGDNGSC